MDIANIADFAASLMTETASPKPTAPALAPTQSQYSNNVGEEAPDVSQVVVPNDFINSIVESATGKPLPAVKQEVTAEVVVETTVPLGKEQPPTVDPLLTEIRDLLLGLRTQLTEMSTAGGIGMGASEPKKKPKEDDKTLSLEDKLKAILQKRKAQ